MIFICILKITNFLQAKSPKYPIDYDNNSYYHNPQYPQYRCRCRRCTGSSCATSAVLPSDGWSMRARSRRVGATRAVGLGRHA